jgi:Baseplate J-like protein
MANGSINLVNLDFETLKESFKSHLSSQTIFKDYDLTGSNLNVLLDVMSYNTYINSFYLNMVASEMFLDTAQLRSSVISHAKELNYIPRSFRSAKAVVNIAITPTNPVGVSAVTIPRGTSFTSKVGSNTYSYTLEDNIIVTGSSNGTFTASNVDIYEGALITDTFVYNAAATNQRFILSNPTIDTTSIRVYVTENNGSSILTYNQANSYVGIDSSSQVFFMQASESDLYEVVFGNDTQGRVPKHGSVISVVYRVGNGELPNGCAVFSSDDAIDGHTNIKVYTVQEASGGAIHETTDMIRKNAPRYFQTQERAVTATDYRTLLQLAFPEIVAIHVFGGEEAEPPRYGKVILSVDVDNADGVSDSKKEDYRKYLKERCPITIDPIFIDPEFINVEVYTNAVYNLNTSAVSENELQSVIKTQVRIFNELNLNDFDTTLRYSRLIKQIDESNDSIASNSTELVAYKDIVPKLNSSEPFTVRFLNPLKVLNSAYVHPYVDNHAVSSTYFTYNGAMCKIEDDGNGVIRVVSLTMNESEHTTIVDIGTVDYATGEVVFSAGLNITSYEGSAIRLRAVTDSKDIVAAQNNIIRIKDTDIYVSVTGQRL